MKWTALLSVWSLTLLAPPAMMLRAGADVVYLKDGTKVEGDILRKTEAGWSVKTADGTVVNVDADKVKGFEAKRGNPAEEPLQRLLSLRRTVEGQTDIRKILGRYKKFVEQHVGLPVVEEALKDVEIWEQRLADGKVKVGDKWVTKDEQALRQTAAAERTADVRRMLLQGKLKEATAAIDSTLAEDPQNAAALYLRGVVLFRQGQTAAARKAFDGVIQLSPDHSPSLNNVAVILSANKQYLGAINYYGQAMNAAPMVRPILDNVAEALNELPEAQRDNEAAKNVVLLFNAQDMALQTRMKKEGLFRWGSTWVKETELGQVKAEQDQINDKLERMEAEFEQVQDRIEQLGRDIDDTERSIRRIEAQSYGRDSTGRAIRLSYPRLYYDLKRDLEQLYGERDGEEEKSARLKKKARQARQALSIPRYTSVQQIIGVEGAPDLPPLTEADLGGDGDLRQSPTTAPSTAPAAIGDKVGSNAS